MIARGQLVVGITLAAALALTGCGEGADELQQHVPGARRHLQHGGEVLLTRPTKSAQQVCQAHGGYYDIGTDYCEIGN